MLGFVNQNLRLLPKNPTDDPYIYIINSVVGFFFLNLLAYVFFLLNISFKHEKDFYSI